MVGQQMVATTSPVPFWVGPGLYPGTVRPALRITRPRLRTDGHAALGRASARGERSCGIYPIGCAPPVSHLTTMRSQPIARRR